MKRASGERQRERHGRFFFFLEKIKWEAGRNNYGLPSTFVCTAKVDGFGFEKLSPTRSSILHAFRTELIGWTKRRTFMRLRNLQLNQGHVQSVTRRSEKEICFCDAFGESGRQKTAKTKIFRLQKKKNRIKNRQLQPLWLPVPSASARFNFRFWINCIRRDLEFI